MGQVHEIGYNHFAFMDFFYELDHSLSTRLLKPFFVNVLLEDVALPCTLPLAVYLDFLDAEWVESSILSHFSLKVSSSEASFILKTYGVVMSDVA